MEDRSKRLKLTNPSNIQRYVALTAIEYGKALQKKDDRIAQLEKILKQYICYICKKQAGGFYNKTENCWICKRVICGTCTYRTKVVISCIPCKDKLLMCQSCEKAVHRLPQDNMCWHCLMANR